MDPTEYIKLECTIAAMLAAAGTSETKGVPHVWARYREALLIIRRNGGPLQDDIKKNY
jgi:hypothetical protein